MWDGYKPTAKERKAIEGAYSYLYHHQMQNPHMLDDLMKQERKGYGNRHDAIPAIGAKALCVKWFHQGVTTQKDALLRDTYSLRPAAVWLIGHGAWRATSAPAINMTALELGLEAHETAFKRMAGRGDP